MSRSHTSALAHLRILRPVALAVHLACAALVIGNFAAPGLAHAQAAAADTTKAGADGATLPAITVTADGIRSASEEGSYTAKASNTATRFDMPLRETPQSVSVVTRAQMQDFGYQNVNDALASAPGITVERVETDRTYYTARGFDITNFQLDGIGVPFMYGNNDGSIDTVIYDRIDVLRGATGLMSNLSNPSATINFVRKRPTAKFNAAAGVIVGSWNDYRVEGDISSALTEQGNVRGRVVAAYQNRDSYLDRYSHEKSVFYGVVDADLSANTVLTLGHHQQNNNADSPLWGALPFFDTSGNRLNYDVSTSTSTDWAYWNGNRTGSFAELAHYFDNGWQAKAVLQRNKITEYSKLFYVYGTPNPTTPGSDLFAYPSRYDKNAKDTVFDLYATGPFTLFGKKHELMAGANWSEAKLNDISNYGEGIGTEIPSLETWDGNYPEPAFTAGTQGSSFKDKQKSVYAAAKLNLTDRLMLLSGARVTDLDSEGVSYGNRRDKSYGTKVTPYIGTTFRLNDTYSLYGSYTKLFRPQTEVDITGMRLDPVTGKSYEAGVKAEFLDKKLNSSFAVFKAKQNNLAQFGGFSTFMYYTPSDEISSKGYEIDAAGEVTPNLQLAAGYTYVSIEDSAGEAARTFVPKRLFRVSSTYRIPAMPQLKVGGSINWQGETYREQGTATTGANAGSTIVTRQDSYAVLNLMAAYDFSKNTSATLNINNVTDEKYLNSLYWAQAYYGAPRNVQLALRWKY